MKKVPREKLVSPYVKGLFYGEPGSGKTRLVGTAALDPRMSPVLMIDAGGNPISLREYEKVPDIVTLDEIEDLNLIYEWLSAGQPATKAIQDLGLTPGYKTVIIDHITDIQRLSFRKVTGNLRTGPGSIPQPTEIQHFNRVLGQMVTFGMLYYGLQMHVLMTALERQDKDDITGAMMQKPLLWGQSSSEMAGYAYVVARMVHRTRMAGNVKMTIAEDPIAKESEVVALFHPSGKYVAKDQYLTLGDYMASPTMTKILDAITNGGT